MTKQDDIGLVRAVERIAKSAHEQAKQRFTEQGRQAPPGAPNPYKPGCAAATWWQQGNDRKVEPCS